VEKGDFGGRGGGKDMLQQTFARSTMSIVVCKCLAHGQEVTANLDQG
jgi:hypothetical protein